MSEMLFPECGFPLTRDYHYPNFVCAFMPFSALEDGTPTHADLNEAFPPTD